MRASIKSVLSWWFENVQMILYREARDFSKGFYSNPRWFLMRKAGRFESVKSIVNWSRRLRQRGVAVQELAVRETLFKGVDIERTVAELSQEGLCLGLDLPSHIVRELLRVAEQTQCYGNGKPDLGFFHRDKALVSEQLGLRLSTADFFNTDQIEVIQRVVCDPTLLAIAGRYLGGVPVHQGTRLRWSYGVELSELEKYKYSRSFHYDLDDYKAVKFFFYLTDVGMESGPHVCVRGSHKLKRFTYRVLRGRCSDDDIATFYGVEKVAVICGESGFGFVEDTSCMHKGLSPVGKHRLILILEYALHDYGMQHDGMDELRLKACSPVGS